MPEPISAETQNTADRGTGLAMDGGNEAQGFQVSALKPPHRFETLGSSSEVNRFRV